MIDYFSQLTVASCFFYFFAFLTVLSSTIVISVRNPVYSVLFLILAFFNAAGIFIILGAEFIGMLMIIVYVGAVAVLFLFVVMMLDKRDTYSLKKNKSFRYIVFFILSLMGGEILFFSRNWLNFFEEKELYIDLGKYSTSNIQDIGQVLYTDYFYPFQIAGLILFSAMIGAIILTFKGDKLEKKQKISKQVERTKNNSIKLCSPDIGKGI